MDEARVGRLVSKLSKFTGVKIDVYAFPVGNPWNKTESEDSIRLAQAIAGALIAARIDTAGWIAESCETWVSNVVVTVKGTSPADLKTASEILETLETLNPEVATFPQLTMLEDILCRNIRTLDTSRPNNRSAVATIRILVGRKIASILTPETLGLKPPRK